MSYETNLGAHPVFSIYFSDVVNARRAERGAGDGVD